MKYGELEELRKLCDELMRYSAEMEYASGKLAGISSRMEDLVAGRMGTSEFTEQCINHARKNIKMTEECHERARQMYEYLDQITLLIPPQKPDNL